MDSLGASFDFVADSFRLASGVTRTWVPMALHVALASGLLIASTAALLTRLAPGQAIPICAALAFPAIVWGQQVKQ